MGELHILNQSPQNVCNALSPIHVLLRKQWLEWQDCSVMLHFTSFKPPFLPANRTLIGGANLQVHVIPVIYAESNADGTNTSQFCLRHPVCSGSASVKRVVPPLPTPRAAPLWKRGRLPPRFACHRQYESVFSAHATVADKQLFLPQLPKYHPEQDFLYLCDI
jgi:hypothetical protein